MIKYKTRPRVRSKEGNMIVKRIKMVQNWDLREHSEVGIGEGRVLYLIQCFQVFLFACAAFAIFEVHMASTIVQLLIAVQPRTVASLSNDPKTVCVVFVMHHLSTLIHRIDFFTVL